MVVTAEDLSVRNRTRLQETMDQVYAFCNLPPYKLPLDLQETLLGKAKVDEENEMSVEMYEKLNAFFLPFMEMLHDITDLPLDHWLRKPVGYQ